jgi:hypothetical protein
MAAPQPTARPEAMTGAVVVKQLRKVELLGECPLCEHPECYVTTLFGAGSELHRAFLRFTECDVFDASPNDCIDYVWPYFIEPSTVEVPDGEE